MKFRVEPKIDWLRNAMSQEYWAIGYDVPQLKEIARAETKERAEEIARLLTLAASDPVISAYSPPAPIPSPPASKWWEIWK